MSEVVRKELPKGWQWTTMEDIADVIGGGTPKSKEKRFFDGGEIPWLTPADLSGYTAKHISRGARNITEAGLNGSSAKLMPAGTVLFTSRAPIGYVAIASNEISTNQGFKSFVLKSKDILPDYVYWWLKGNKQLAESFASGTTFLELSGSKAKKLPIPIAPPEQQKRIVAKIEELFSHIDAGIEALKTAKQLLKQYRQSVLKAAVTGELTKEWREANKDKLVPATALLKEIEAEKERLIKNKKLKRQKELTELEDDEKSFEIPPEWEWCKFGLIAEFINGDRGKNYPNKSEYVDSGVPWINTGHINPDGSLSESDMNFITREKFDSLRSGKIREGDLVYCLRGATFGKTAFVTPYKEGSIASSLMIIRPYIFELNTFIYRYLTSTIGKDQLFRFDNGSAQPNLSANSVKLYAFPLPPLKEQKEINKVLEQKFSAIEHLERELDDQLIKAERNKQSVLASAFSGGI